MTAAPNSPPPSRVLADLRWPEVSRQPWPVVLLPWGATEPHNTHLPYGTDTLLGGTVANRVAARCAELGVSVLALPAVPFGVNTTQLDLPMTINIMPSTQLAVLRDVVRSVAPHGVRVLVLVNAHGGNELRALVRELQPETRVLLVIVNWWQVANSAVFTEPGDHAGELETAAMLHVAPHLVAPRDQWSDGAAKASVFAGVREGWAWLPRRWTQVTRDTGVGNPREATDERGATFVAEAVEKIATLCVELSAADHECLYE
jgi:creatinine amidohydrolase